jgi:hypothetical protein
MKILVNNEEEAVNVARRLTVLCNTIRLSNINYVEQSSAETFLCALRDSVCIEKPVDNSEAVQLLKEAIHDCEYFLTGDEADPITILYDRLGRVIDLLEGESDDIQG